MILYTEKQLMEAYSDYIRGLKTLEDPVLRLRMLPSLEEFRVIFEQEHENKLFDDMENHYD